MALWSLCFCTAASHKVWSVILSCLLRATLSHIFIFHAFLTGGSLAAPRVAQIISFRFSGGCAGHILDILLLVGCPELQARLSQIIDS